MVRSYSENQLVARKYASVVAILGAIDAPLIYLASMWWRNLHPRLNIGPLAESDSSLDSKMLLTLLVSTITFTVFYIYLLIERIEMRKIEDELDEVHRYASNKI
jgi:heme exporter protein C